MSKGLIKFSKYFIINLLNEMKERKDGTATTNFAEKFGEKGTGSYFAPGRINLIGEHTDYNGGYVFPASITIGTYGVARNGQISKYVFIRKTS